MYIYINVYIYKCICIQTCVNIAYVTKLLV